MSLTVNHKDNESYLGDKPLLKLAREKNFSELIFILLAEREPSKDELSIFELILNISIDHGPDTPSAKAVIEKAKGGENIGEAVASGMREINDVHGGAQEALMPILYKIVKEKLSAENIVKEFVENKKRLPGFGHRLYKDNDPRAELIITTLVENGLGEDYVAASRALQKSLKDITGKTLPLNIDGAIAVALCAFGLPPSLGKPIFMIARTPGLCAHYLNNKPIN
ncbi:MAG: citrate/2-methylcitrate synthase [Patescibacteria group bacterium]